MEADCDTIGQVGGTLKLLVYFWYSIKTGDSCLFGCWLKIFI